MTGAVPTEPGWYWAFEVSGAGRFETKEWIVVRVDQDMDVVCPGNEYPFRRDDFDAWGPRIHPPEDPHDV